MGGTPAMRLPLRTEQAPHQPCLDFRLDCGREVSVERCYISGSTLGYLEGSREDVRNDIIKTLPERVRHQFPGDVGVFVKPASAGELPAYTFMVSLVCYAPVSDPNKDISRLVVCWLGDDIETSLPKLMDREICDVEWDKY